MSLLPAPDFGALLRHHRRVAGLTQEELAERAGVSVNAIGAMERGLTRAPHKDTIALLAEALQLSQEERAELEAAARGRAASMPAPTRDTSLHLVRDDVDQAEPGQPAATQPLTLASFASQVERPNPLESALPQKPPPLLATRQRKRVALGLLTLLVVVAAGSGMVYWLRLGLFGKDAAATATPPPAYAYAQPTHRGGTITFSGDSFPGASGPWFQGAPLEVELANALWGVPFTISPTGTLLPDELLEIPTPANGGVSKDGLTVTLHLRSDLKWSDGQPLTADDLVYWLEVELDPATGAITSGYDQIANPQVLDAHTLVLHYKRLFVSYLYYLPLAAPRHLWGTIPRQELGKRDEVRLYPQVTSGPFKLESYVPEQSMALVPNPYYRSTTLHQSVLDHLIFTAAPNTDALIAAFGAGETDFTDSYFSLGDLPRMSGLADIHVTHTIGYTHLEFNLLNPVLQDEHVRQAMEEAMDRCGMIQSAYQQPCSALGLDTILPTPSPAYDPTIKAYGYNLAAARQDMQVAGWDCSSGTCRRASQPFPPLQLATLPFFQPVAELVKRDLERLGIPVSLSYYSYDDLFGDYTSGGVLAQGRYDLSLFFIVFTSDLDGDLYLSFHSSQIPSASNPAGGNFEQINDPNIDSLLDQARGELDLAARLRLYKDLQRELVKYVYVVPLSVVPLIALVNPNIGNYQDNPTNSGNLWNVGDWFLKQ